MDNIAYASITNGESALLGKKEMRIRWKSLIITKG